MHDSWQGNDMELDIMQSTSRREYLLEDPGDEHVDVLPYNNHVPVRVYEGSRTKGENGKNVEIGRNAGPPD